MILQEGHKGSKRDLPQFCPENFLKERNEVLEQRLLVTAGTHDEE